jgi:hypothetical protein
LKLDSVRDLTHTLKQKVFEQLSLSAQDAATFGLPSGRIADFDPLVPTLSLGVTPAGPGDFKVAVRIQKKGLETSPHVALILQDSGGEAVVKYVGPATKHAPWYQSRQRPLLIGCSIGHYKTIGGTLGCFVTLKGGDGSARILSNNHVLADENRAKTGDDIIQPNTTDGGTKGPDTVGSLDTFVRLQKKGANKVDCALATLKAGIGSDQATLTGVGKLAGLQSAPTGVSLVQKLGRTTGPTNGRVTAFDLDNLVVTYDTGTYRFDDQIEIEGAAAGPFTKPGDSGSLVFTSGTLLAFGLVMAGTATGGSNGAGLTYANSMVNVLNALNAQLLP